MQFLVMDVVEATCDGRGVAMVRDGCAMSGRISVANKVNYTMISYVGFSNINLEGIQTIEQRLLRLMVD